MERILYGHHVVGRSVPDGAILRSRFPMEYNHISYAP